MPKLEFNLLILTSFMDKKYQLLWTDEELLIKEINIRVIFDRKVKTLENLYGYKIILSYRTSEIKLEDKEIKGNEYHRKLGHQTKKKWRILTRTKDKTLRERCRRDLSRRLQ